METKLLGVVLCGGESRRMGTDKGLISIGHASWAEHVAGKLSAIPVPVVISVNLSQKANYEVLFSSTQLIIDEGEINGPLKGIISVHNKFPESDLLLMACDMINMQVSTLAALVTVHQTEPSFDFYVYQQGEFAEPFPGIYSAKGLKEAVVKISTGKFHGFSLQEILANGHTLKLKPDNFSDFDNYNYS